MQMNCVSIKTLEGFEIKKNSEWITSGAKPKKIWHLFKILLLHYNMPLHYEQIYEYVGLAKTKDVKSLIKNMIYRLRKHLMSLEIYDDQFIQINYANECYKLVLGTNCHFDLESLDQLNKNENPLLDYQLLFSNFQNILPEERYAEWLFPIKSVYEHKHTQVTKAVLFQLFEKKKFAEMEKLADFALKLYPDDEMISVYLLKSYMQQGKRAEAIKYYYGLEDRLYEEYGVEPSTTLKEIMLLINETKIQTETEDIPLDGALVCGMSEFMKIHQLEKRKALRNPNQMVCLNVKIKSSDIKKHEHIEKISSQILKSLRQSDVFAEENTGSYYILLQDIDTEIVKRIETRIVSHINTQFETDNIFYEIQYIS